jgi:hypothetical protein
MDWLTNTPFLSEVRGFLLYMSSLLLIHVNMSRAHQDH